MSAQRRNVIRSPVASRGGPQAPLFLLLAFCLASPSAAWAGGIIGTVRDATTSAPVGSVDLDVWDLLFVPVGVTTLTAVDGTYNIALPSGQYYLRVDPTNAQLYVDQFYPGVFLKSGAQLITVPAIGNVTVNFNLHQGGTISGHVFDQLTSAPIAGVDVDVFVLDTTLGTREFAGSINAATDVTGAYSLGRFPPGTYYIRAQPAALLFRQTRYYSGKLDLASANPLIVVGLGDIPNVDFNLPVAGAVVGLITKSDAPGSPLSKIDIDLYDAAGTFVSGVSAKTDNAGQYALGPIVAGSYYVRANPGVTQGYVTEYWPGTVKIAAATRLTVTNGTTTTANFTLPPGGTISGIATSLATGLPVVGAKITVFDDLFDIVIGAGATTDAAGKYEAGVLLPGAYKIRATPGPASGLAFQFWNNVTLGLSQGTAINVAVNQRQSNIQFVLPAGGTITGTVRNVHTLAPIVNADLDVFASNDEFIGAVDAKTDINGAYTLTNLPAGSYKVKASMAPTSFLFEYWNHQTTKAAAVLVPVAAPGTVSGIHFTLGAVSDAGQDPQTAGVAFGRAEPNPFVDATHIQFSLQCAARVAANVYDPAGHCVRRLMTAQAMAAGSHEILWDGRDNHARQLPAGVYWLRIEVDGRQIQRKLVRTHS